MHALRRNLVARGWVAGSLLLLACGEGAAGDGGPGGSGGSDGDGAPAGGSGGASSGGAASGGAPSGGNSTGGSSTGGTEADPPEFETSFSADADLHVVTKSQLIPGATATRAADESAADGEVARLFIAGNPSLGSDDYAGPGAHAIELDFEHPAQLYGRYEMTVRFPECGAGEELVSGLFTYFNDGSDEDDDGIADNSEIDIEHLCGDPAYLWLTVWTDYESAPAEQFRRTSRLVNMRTGATQTTELGGSSWGGLSASAAIPGLALTDFPAANTYYRLGFEWRADSVRYFLIHEGVEIELWKLSGAEYVPQRPAEFLINLWHPDTHWSKAGDADFPANDAELRIDWLGIWP